MDSTVLDDAFARQDTITQLIATVRRFGWDIPGGQDLVVSHANGYDYTRTGMPDIAWDDQDAQYGLISAFVTDALALLAVEDPKTLDGKAADAYALLAVVAVVDGALEQFRKPAGGAAGFRHPGFQRGFAGCLHRAGE